jgi:hypothetical protein
MMASLFPRHHALGNGRGFPVPDLVQGFGSTSGEMSSSILNSSASPEGAPHERYASLKRGEGCAGSRMLWEGTMPILTRAQLREDSRLAKQIAEKKTDPHLKRAWASYALALAQLAEQIERRDEAVRVKELVA